MPVPDNADAVLTAVRLGWCIAEVRGRNRPDARTLDSAAPLLNRQGSALPLQNERTTVELRLQAQAALISLADKAGADTNPADGSSFSEKVDRQATELAKLRASGLAEAREEWENLAELIYTFDGHIQDNLTGKSPNEVAGYQLGRGLAECYWALDPQVPPGSKDSPGAWWFLLGRERVRELGELLRLLSAYFYPYTADAIAGTLFVWHAIAADEKWRSDADKPLYRQIYRWHSLTALGEDPTVFISTANRLWTYRMIQRVIRIYGFQIWLGTVGVVALVVLIARFGKGAGTLALNAFLGILAAAGLTVASFSALPIVKVAKSNRLALAILITPPRPTKRRSKA